MKEFLINTEDGRNRAVSYAQVVLPESQNRTLFVLDWSVSNFGFGEFVCFKNQETNQVTLDNEYVGRETVEMVFSNAFYNLINPSVDRLNIGESMVDYDFLIEKFKVKENSFQVLYTVQKFSKFIADESGDEFLKFEFWYGLEELFVVELKKYPEFDELDEAHYSFSELLNKGDFRDYFVSAKVIYHKWNCNDLKNENKEKELVDAHLIKNDASNAVHLAYKFKDENSYHFNILMNCPKTNRTMIEKFPYSKDMLAKIGLFIGKTIKMTDVF